MLWGGFCFFFSLGVTGWGMFIVLGFTGGVQYTPVRKVLAQRKVLWKSPGGYRCTNTSGLILDPIITPHNQSFRPPEVQ